MTGLLDVNALVAQAWPNHVHHAAVTRWLAGHHTGGWAACPVTESGFVRVSSNQRVLADARSPSDAIALLAALRQLDGHTFWRDGVSLTHTPELDLERLRGYRQVTDAHLLLLAIRSGGTLVTFDQAVGELAPGDHVTLLGMV